MPVPVPANAKRVYANTLHEVWEWDQELYDGSHATFSCVKRHDTASIIPFLDANTILLIKEEQPGRDPFMDVPGGVIEVGEDPDVGVARELKEETGYHGEVLKFREHTYTGMTRFIEFVYLATQLKDGAGPHPDAGERIQLIPTPWKDAVAMCLRGELRRTEAMLAILAMEFDPEARALKERFLKSA